MLSPRTHARRPDRVYPARTMLRRENGQILPGLIMLMLAILGIGMLTFRIGRAAVLRSGAQTAADAAALAGARSIRDQLLAQQVTTGTSDLARVSEAVVRLRAADYAKRNGGRLTDLKLEGADVRVWVDTDDEKVDPPKSERRGKATARGRVELIAAPGFPLGGGAFGGGGVAQRLGDRLGVGLPADLDDRGCEGRDRELAAAGLAWLVRHGLSSSCGGPGQDGAARGAEQGGAGAALRGRRATARGLAAAAWRPDRARRCGGARGRAGAHSGAGGRSRPRARLLTGQPRCATDGRRPGSAARAGTGRGFRVCSRRR